MGCKIKTSFNRHWQTEGEVEYPSRDGGISISTILRNDRSSYFDPVTFEIEIKSTPGFEQKLLRKGRKWTVTIIGVGLKKPFVIGYYPQE